MLRYLIKSDTQLLEEYRCSNEKEFKRNYKICVNEDGSIFDTLEKKCYSNLSQWAKSIKGDTK